MRLSFVLLGHACLAVGAVGLVVPLLPTTPFVLLAAFCYSKGSDRLHRRLTAHPRFGAPVRDWQRHGVIRPRAKWVSTALIVASLSYPILFKDLPDVAKVAAGLVGIGVLTFIHTRPSQPGGGTRRGNRCRTARWLSPLSLGRGAGGEGRPCAPVAPWILRNPACDFAARGVPRNRKRGME